MKTWIKDFIDSGVPKKIWRTAITICSLGALIAFLHTEKPFWGIYYLIFFVWREFAELTEKVEARQTLNLKHESIINNWIFVDEDGLPVVLPKKNAPDKNDIAAIALSAQHARTGE